MTSLQVRFPEQWATLPVGGPEGAIAAGELVSGMGELDRDAQVAMDAYLTAVLPTLQAWGIDGVASLVLPDEAGGLIQAFCAISLVQGETGDAAELRRVVEAGPHPGLERETTEVDLPAGTAVRSAAFRFAEELLDAEGVAPYSGEVRYAFPLPDDRIGILHFETLSLIYFRELAGLFDAIAETTRIG
jgi:hypothetical protein